MYLFGLTLARLRINPLAGSATILCIGGLDSIRKDAWPFYRTISGARLYWVLEEPKGPKGPSWRVLRPLVPLIARGIPQHVEYGWVRPGVGQRPGRAL